MLYTFLNPTLLSSSIKCRSEEKVKFSTSFNNLQSITHCCDFAVHSFDMCNNCCPKPLGVPTVLITCKALLILRIEYFLDQYYNMLMAYYIFHLHRAISYTCLANYDYEFAGLCGTKFQPSILLEKCTRLGFYNAEFTQ